MKKAARRVVVGLVLACCGMPAVAEASETATLRASFSPYRLGAGTTVRMHTDFGTTNGELPGPVTSFDMHIPPSLELIGSKLGLAICQPTALAEEGLPACPTEAQIGTGSATVKAPFGPEIVAETATISIFMAPPEGENIGVMLFAESRTPIFAQLIFPGSVIIGSGPVGETLSTTLPGTPTLPGARDASVTSTDLNIGPEHLTYYKRVHGRRVGYHPAGVALPAVCPRGGFVFVADMRFEDGTVIRTPATVPCPAHHRRHSRG